MKGDSIYMAEPRIKKLFSGEDFPDRCRTLTFKELQDETVDIYYLFDHNGTRYCAVDRKRCWELVQAGKIGWQQKPDGTQYINEVGFKKLPNTYGYGHYFPSQQT